MLVLAPWPEVASAFRVCSTSTWSPGRMKPPAPVSAVIGTDMARMPGDSDTAMIPPAPPLTSLAAAIGSLASMGMRTTEPISGAAGPRSPVITALAVTAAPWAAAASLALVVTAMGSAEPATMNCLLMASAGQGCQAMLSGPSTSPTAKSCLATSTRVVGLATGAAITGAGRLGAASPRAKKAAPNASTSATKLIRMIRGCAIGRRLSRRAESASSPSLTRQG